MVGVDQPGGQLPAAGIQGCLQHGGDVAQFGQRLLGNVLRGIGSGVQGH